MSVLLRWAGTLTLNPQAIAPRVSACHLPVLGPLSTRVHVSRPCCVIHPCCGAGAAVAPVARQEARMGHNCHGAPEPYLADEPPGLRLHPGDHIKPLKIPMHRFLMVSSLMAAR